MVDALEKFLIKIEIIRILSMKEIGNFVLVLNERDIYHDIQCDPKDFKRSIHELIEEKVVKIRNVFNHHTVYYELHKEFSTDSDPVGRYKYLLEIKKYVA